MAPTLESLPAEIEHEIFRHITHRRDLYSLLRANRRLCELALPYLYTSIYIPPIQRSPIYFESHIRESDLRSLSAGAKAHAAYIQTLHVGTKAHSNQSMLNVASEALAAVQSKGLYALIWPSDVYLSNRHIRTREIASTIAALPHLSILKLGQVTEVDEPLGAARFALKAFSALYSEPTTRFSPIPQGQTLAQQLDELEGHDIEASRREIALRTIRNIVHRSQQTLEGLSLSFRNRGSLRAFIWRPPLISSTSGNLSELVGGLNLCRLKRLCLNGPFKLDEHVADAIDFSKLVELRLTGTLNLSKLSQALGARGVQMPDLKKLSVNGTQDVVAGFLSGLSQVRLVELVLDIDPLPGPVPDGSGAASAVCDAVHGLGGTLQRLTLGKTSQSVPFSPVQLEHMVSAHPRLRALEVAVKGSDVRRVFGALCTAHNLEGIHLRLNGSPDRGLLDSGRHRFRGSNLPVMTPQNEHDLFARGVLLDLVECVGTSSVIRTPMDRDYNFWKESALRTVALTGRAQEALRGQMFTAVYAVEAEKRQPDWKSEREDGRNHEPDFRDVPVYAAGWKLTLKKIEGERHDAYSRCIWQGDLVEGTVLFG